VLIRFPPVCKTTPRLASDRRRRRNRFAANGRSLRGRWRLELPGLSRKAKLRVGEGVTGVGSGSHGRGSGRNRKVGVGVARSLPNKVGLHLRARQRRNCKGRTYRRQSPEAAVVLLFKPKWPCPSTRVLNLVEYDGPAVGDYVCGGERPRCTSESST